jgi:hypothetical protein
VTDEEDFFVLRSVSRHEAVDDAELYDRLGLDFNEAARQTIGHFTSEKSSGEVSFRRYGGVPLNSRRSIYAWEKRLTFWGNRESTPRDQ